VSWYAQGPCTSTSRMLVLMGSFCGAHLQSRDDRHPCCDHPQSCGSHRHAPRQLLAHLYAKTDAASLAALRRELLRPPYSTAEAAAGAAAGAAALAGDCPHRPRPHTPHHKCLFFPHPHNAAAHPSLQVWLMQLASHAPPRVAAAAGCASDLTAPLRAHAWVCAASPGAPAVGPSPEAAKRRRGAGSAWACSAQRAGLPHSARLYFGAGQPDPQHSERNVVRPVL